MEELNKTEENDFLYNYQWLFERLTEIRMADKVLQTEYRFGEEDPEIKNVKNKLYKIKANLEWLEIEIYNLMERGIQKKMYEELKENDSLNKQTKCDVTTLSTFDEINQIENARSTMRKAFEKDKDFKNTYIANIAMLLYDHHGITEYTARNQAAKEILELIFSK